MSKDKKQETVSAPPTGFKMIVREFKKDKLALFSLGLLVVLLLTIFIGAMFLDKDAVMKVSIFDKYGEPGVNGFILGADEGGRDVFGQLIIGARNSVVIGLKLFH